MWIGRELLGTIFVRWRRKSIEVLSFNQHLAHIYSHPPDFFYSVFSIGFRMSSFTKSVFLGY